MNQLLMKFIYRLKILNNPVFSSAAAIFIFLFLIWWHLNPIFPVIAQKTPSHFDMSNNIVELLSPTRSLIRHPLHFSSGQYAYPYPYSNALLNSNYLAGLPFYIVYMLSDNPCLAYNSMLLLIFFLNAFSVYILIRLWTGSWLAGIFAGAVCAFFPHRFHEMAFYQYQMTFVTAFVMYAWLLFLKNGKRWQLILFFILITSKAVSIDYNTLFLLIVLIVIIPTGFFTYPTRLRKHWWLFILLSIISWCIILPFCYPYYINLHTLPGDKWTYAAIQLDFITWKELVKLFTNFFYNISHIRSRGQLALNAPIWPGIISVSLAVVSTVWILISGIFKRREYLLRLTMISLAFAAIILVCTPAYKLSGRPVSFSPFVTLCFDPPILAFIRYSRAFIFSIMLCFSIIIGISVGDFLSYFNKRSLWLRYTAITGVLILLCLATLEHTVKIDTFSNNVPCTLNGFYEWLANQPKPSTFIEFPHHHGMASYVPVMKAVLADQPTGVAIGRTSPMMSYFLMDIGNTPFSTRKIKMLEASPYKFWVQKNYNNDYKTKVETLSSLKYATNFGSTYVFENSEIERSFPLDISMTQKWSLSFPYVYSIHIHIDFTSQFTFVKSKERRLTFDCDFVDTNEIIITSLKIKGELPFMLEGPRYLCSLHIIYDPVKHTLKGFFKNSGHFNMEKQPVASIKCDDTIFNTKAIKIKLLQPATQKSIFTHIQIDKIPSRWPFKFGTPYCIPHLVGGFSPMQKIDGITCQRSIGKSSAFYNGKPPSRTTAIKIKAKSAIKEPPKPLSVTLHINDIFQTTFILSNEWIDYTIPVPTNVWKKINKFIFYYSDYYFPCLLEEGSDENPRCAIFSEISAISAMPTIKKQQKQFSFSFSDNLISNKKWKLWRNGNIYTNQIILSQTNNQQIILIENPQAKLIGVSQSIPVHSGKIYQISGEARSGGSDKTKIFGGRIGFNLIGQNEKQIIWMMDNNTWTKNSLIFTNSVSGIATLFVHLGYGNISQTGEFKNISLKELK